MIYSFQALASLCLIWSTPLLQYASFVCAITYEGTVSTFAGGLRGYADGVGTNAMFTSIYAISFSSNGKFAVAADCFNHVIRHIDISTSNFTLFAGEVSVGGGFSNGIGKNAKFLYPTGISISHDDIFALVAEDTLIRRIEMSTVNVTTVARRVWRLRWHRDQCPLSFPWWDCNLSQWSVRDIC
jgi:hypothetical protein